MISCLSELIGPLLAWTIRRAECEAAGLYRSLTIIGLLSDDDYTTMNHGSAVQIEQRACSKTIRGMPSMNLQPVTGAGVEFAPTVDKRLPARLDGFGYKVQATRWCEVSGVETNYIGVE